MDKILELIINGSDWESVLKEIVVEENLDLMGIDLMALSDAMIKYLSEMRTINFRIPARFILISAIILRLKSESLIEMEVTEKVPETLDIEGIENLEMPLKRLPVRNITFEELTMALNKVLQGTKTKEEIQITRAKKIEDIRKIIEMDVDDYIGRIYVELQRIRKTTFFTLTHGKERLDSAKYFVAMLHLATQQKLDVKQEVIFEDIDISVRDMEAIKEAIENGGAANAPSA
ncbi:MAG: hypothetical protein ACP5E4_02965 [Candidatus Aenigmatarchaeota archaeon]